MDVQPKTKLIRSLTIESPEINQESRIIDFSFSSEYPVQRKNGVEVLSHRAGDYDFTELNDNAPLCLEHDLSRQIGKVVKSWVSGEKGYVQVQFSRSQEATEVLNDITDGIRSKISFGYYAYNPKLDKNQAENRSTYRYQWKPFEVSIVSRPADPTVGIGRSESDIDIQIPASQESDESNIIQRNENMESLQNVADVISAIESETQTQEEVRSLQLGASIDDLTTLCRHFRMEDEVAGLVERSATLEDAKTYLLDQFKARNAAVSKSTRAAAAPAVHIKQERTFSKAKAFQAAASGEWDKAGYEREMCQERAKSASRGWDKNVVILDAQEQVGTRAALTGNAVGASGFGSNLVGTEYRPEKLIDALWNKTFLDKVGTDNFLGLQGNQSIPVINTNATSTWVAETGALPTEQRLGTASKTLSPKELVSKFAYSRQLLIQGLPNIEQKVMEQLYASIAQALDAAAISNSGITLSTTGLLNEITQIVALGTNGAAPTLKTFTDLRKLLVASKVDPDNATLVMSGALKETLATTLKDSGNTNSGYILQEGVNTIRGNGVVWSQNVPSNLTKGTGTNLSAAILGDFSQFAVAQWGNIAVEFDPISAADYSQIVIRSYSFWDMAIKRLEAFAIVKDVIA